MSFHVGCQTQFGEAFLHIYTLYCTLFPVQQAQPHFNYARLMHRFISINSNNLLLSDYQNAAETCVYYIFIVPFFPPPTSRWVLSSCSSKGTARPTTGCDALRRNLCQRTSASSCSRSLSGWSCWTMWLETQVRVCRRRHICIELFHSSYS